VTVYGSVITALRRGDHVASRRVAYVRWIKASMRQPLWTAYCRTGHQLTLSVQRNSILLSPNSFRRAHLSSRRVLLLPLTEPLADDRMAEERTQRIRCTAAQEEILDRFLLANPTARLENKLLEDLRSEHFNDAPEVTNTRLRGWIQYRRSKGRGTGAAPPTPHSLAPATAHQELDSSSAVAPVVTESGTPRLSCACRGACSVKTCGCFVDATRRRCCASCACTVAKRCTNPANALPDELSLPLDQCLVDWLLQNHTWSELPLEFDLACCRQKASVALLAGKEAFECPNCHAGNMFSFCKGQVVKGSTRNHCAVCGVCAPAGSRHCSNCGNCIIASEGQPCKHCNPAEYETFKAVGRCSLS